MALNETKNRYWVAILYPESMIPNWENEIAAAFQVPGVYCIHDKDVDKKGAKRKTHVHCILAFRGPTTRQHALNVFQEIAPTCKECKQVIDIRNMYDYLIHDTDDARKKKKFLYKHDERITFNNFDIGSYEQISLKERNDIAKEIANVIIEKRFITYLDLWQYIINECPNEYQEIARTQVTFFKELCRGNYLKKYHQR